MDIEKIIKERENWYSWKNIVPRVETLKLLPDTNSSYSLDDIIKIKSDIDAKLLREVAFALRPWRKGPFIIDELLIDTEWQSFIKYNLLKPYFDLKDKIVADVGCNNGYYMFKMLEEKPKKLVGFDPSPIYKTQFDFINHFIKSDIKYEFLGIEHIEFYKTKFNIIFCLGVLYHRSDPISSLKSLYRGLQKGGELILDTFMIDGEDEVALTPKDRYSKIPNIYFIPTVNALKNWLNRAKFVDIEVLEITKTNSKEQRRTEWVYSESLNEFLNPENPELTVEGYPAPKRVYIKARREF